MLNTYLIIYRLIAIGMEYRHPLVIAFNRLFLFVRVYRTPCTDRVLIGSTSLSSDDETRATETPKGTSTAF